MKSFKRLLKEMTERGYGVEAEERRALVTLPDTKSSFVLLLADDWIQVAAILVEADQIRDRPGQSRLGDFILVLQGRYLGCRFGYEEDGALKIVEDIYPENLNTEHVGTVTRQLDHVGGALLPLIRAVIDTGRIPDGRAIDAAFSLRPN